MRSSYLRYTVVAAVFVGCSLWFLIPKENSVAKQLEKIPKEDRFLMEVFFRSCALEDDGAYVLFGDKPASLMLIEEWQKQKPTSSCIPYRFSFFFTDFSPEKRGFELWKKYQHLFSSSAYAFVKTRGFFLDRQAAILLIHKQRLLEILKNDFIEFKKIFSQFESPKQLLNGVINDPLILEEIYINHEFLLGIILGFGRENAALYAKKAPLYPRELGVSECKSSSFIPRSIPALEKELALLDATTGSPVDSEKYPNFDLLMINPLGFAVDTTKTDLEQLRSKFNCQYRQAVRAYQQGNFLEVTLNQISKGNS